MDNTIAITIATQTYIANSLHKDLYDDAVTILLSNRFQFTTVWGKKEAI
jgi:hypothetical protein